MKITKKYLNQIIKEEVYSVLKEDESVITAVKNIAYRVPGAHQWIAAIETVTSIKDLYAALKKKSKQINQQIPDWLVNTIRRANKINLLARRNKRSMSDAKQRPNETFAQYRARLTGGDVADQKATVSGAVDAASGDSKKAKIHKQRSRQGAVKGMAAKKAYMQSLKRG